MTDVMKMVNALKRKFKMKDEDIASEIGCTAYTVFNWRTGRSRTAGPAFDQKLKELYAKKAGLPVPPDPTDRAFAEVLAKHKEKKLSTEKVK